ncbi:YibE/F family protein [Candidatus Parcubacteria bacterium]|nr:YibE/F family protein [Candidatus Parcubacteria bacterium]
MKKILLFILILLFIPFLVLAQDKEAIADKVFSARVLEILEQVEKELPDEEKVEQQRIKIKLLDGDEAGKEIVINNIKDFDVIKNNIYKENDKVIVVASFDELGKANYYITDYERSDFLALLFILFILVVIAVGKLKGVRSLFSLAISFLVIVKYLIPQIISGHSPLLTTLIGSIIILFSIIYITEGFKTKSHIAIVSISIGLFISIILSWFFIELVCLSGLASDEMFYLVSFGETVINFKGLLLAGMIIGTLGILDDVVISQVVAVEQIIKANSDQSKKEVFHKAYKVGVSHISSMTNTLFLAYVGVSLPLLILFVSGGSIFGTWGQIINNEVIATEIVRTLTGSIGLILTVPISTLIAVYWIIKNKE